MSGQAKDLASDERFHLALCLGFLFVLAGCIGGSLGSPSEQEEPVALVLNNSANVTNASESTISVGS